MARRHLSIVTLALLPWACVRSTTTAAKSADLAVADVDGDAAHGDAAEPARDASTRDGAAADALAPPRLSIDRSRTSVSGISSGGFMAAQFDVAFSSTIKGAAIFAGGPYGCSQGSAVTATSSCQSGVPAIDVSALVAQTKSDAAAGAIDDPSHLGAQRIFLFGGADDTVVSPTVVDALSRYYAAFLPSASIAYVSRRTNTSHTWPTLRFGNPCAVLASPFIGDCAYDGAGAALAQIYGTLTAAATQLSGTFWTLPQAQFIDQPATHSLADTAYAYVPQSCAAGESCGIHVAFHGCLQSASVVGDAFYKHAGLNEWADTNHLIVLYPQAMASLSAPTNPDGCWDFWGYDSADFDHRSAPQMQMVQSMIDWLAN